MRNHRGSAEPRCRCLFRQMLERRAHLCHLLAHFCKLGVRPLAVFLQVLQAAAEDVGVLVHHI